MTTLTAAQIAHITVIDWEAGEYLDGAEQEVLAAHGITATSDENALIDAAIEIAADALYRNVRLIGTRQWLEDQHDELVSWANGVGRL